MILTTAIISIIISAPLGSIMTNTFGPKWLSNAQKDHGPDIKINDKTGSFHPKHGHPLKIRPLEEVHEEHEKIRRIKTGTMERADEDDYFSQSDDNKFGMEDRNNTVTDLLKKEETQGGENVTKDEER